MNELVSLKGNDVFTDSLLIAEGTGNKHPSVQKIIDNHIVSIEKFGKVRFEIVPLPSGQSQKVYMLNEQQATFLITLLRNTDKVIDFKIELVRQFYQMRKFIIEKQSSQWIETRYHGKLTRKAETDTIQKLVECAQSQGSSHSDMLYVTYSKLANKVVGIQKRDSATISQLNNLTLVENIILHCVENGIITDKYYKDIYQDCKQRLDIFKDIAYLEGVTE